MFRQGSRAPVKIGPLGRLNAILNACFISNVCHELHLGAEAY